MRLTRSRGPGLRPCSTAVGLLGLALALTASGCAARPAEPMSPSAQATAAAPAGDATSDARETAPAQEPSPVTSAEDGDPAVALAEAEGALDRALGGASPSPAAPPQRADEKRSGERPATSPQAEGGDGCEVACRALASMQRSAERLCDLAGSGDARRCEDARARVTRAAGRVEERCPACHVTEHP